MTTLRAQIARVAILATLFFGFLFMAVRHKDELLAMLPMLYALFVLLVYLIPLAVAQHRRHHQTLAIGVLNVVAGWTLLGWIVALVWACTATDASRRKGF